MTLTAPGGGGGGSSAAVHGDNGFAALSLVINNTTLTPTSSGGGSGRSTSLAGTGTNVSLDRPNGYLASLVQGGGSNGSTGYLDGRSGSGGGCRTSAINATSSTQSLPGAGYIITLDNVQRYVGGGGHGSSPDYSVNFANDNGTHYGGGRGECYINNG